MSAPADNGIAIDTSDLGRRYGRRWAIAGVTLQIRRGSAVLLAGRNGSGKSTLLRVLATAIRPHRGTARIEGFDLDHDRAQVRERTALLGHHANTWEALSAIQNLEIPAKLIGAPAGRESLLERLAEVGLAGRGDDAVATFSAGMRKRLSLARVLLQSDPERGGGARTVFLDEPYNQLDPPGFRLVDGLLTRFRDRGITVVMATHLIERATAFCDGGLLLDEGRLVWSGPAAELPEADPFMAAGGGGS